ncbi:hypothetical protein Mterra_01055 [Calidithermus terrae]|uniref:DUF421 domain-containing protein n=1 Tax=Calidithermus terrae TaxID=1408545 RepID=A0A399EWQ1_9DEIN|nr:DUF421 domain-containing protein [Calidithermus terrae]RIH88060.1 hypothetical protein Mterra_01055 [Calidithermus terrae]
MDEAIRVFDLERIFLGDKPLLYALEILFRTAVIFLYTLVLLRWMGKRGMSQLTPFEYVLIVALGSAVGDPMFYPDVPLLHAMVVVTGVVLLQRGLVRLTERNERLERFVESAPTALVRDGRLDLRNLHREGLSRAELFEALREQGIEHLGQVRRAYLEPSGKVSVFAFAPREALPGLPVWPDDDPEQPARCPARGPAPRTGPYACSRCGHVARFLGGEPLLPCDRCGHGEWVEAWRPARLAGGPPG